LKVESWRNKKGQEKFVRTSMHRKQKKLSTWSFGILITGLITKLKLWAQDFLCCHVLVWRLWENPLPPNRNTSSVCKEWETLDKLKVRVTVLIT
jgi:hypothetical protein